MEKYGVTDPDEQWGDYSLLRPWDEMKFLASLRKAEGTPITELKPDGNRAVMFCTTTDPYQAFRGGKSRELTEGAEELVRKALEAIRDHSTLNVRILTRSPLASKHFDLFKTFGNRLMFGMSLPTLNNQLSKIYEPKAPGPSQRLKTLQEAKDAGLHVYVAMAPTYAECDEVDLRATLTAMKKLNPITIFHEPINIRAENVKRIEQHAAKLGVPLKTDVFSSGDAWRQYALDSLRMVQRLAQEMGLIHCLHLWPDADLGSKDRFLELRKIKRAGLLLTKHQEKRHQQEDQNYYEKTYLPWLNGWWTRISEWPGKI